MSNNWHGQAVDGWQFVATLQLRTPLSVLSRHGEKRGTDTPLDQVKMADGIWSPTTKGWEHVGIPSFAPVEMAAEIGPVAADGGSFLKFLIAVRTVVERESAVEARMIELRSELDRAQWHEFVTLYGGAEAIVARFFPAFVDTIPGLSASAARLLANQGLTTPQRISATSDAELLSVKGLGPAKLATIRTACREASNRESAFVDRVIRQ